MATKFTFPRVFEGPNSLPVLARKKQFRGSVTARASRERKGRDHEGTGNIVDENMIVLRMRIHEAIEASSGQTGRGSQNWMEWERQYLTYYKEDVLEGIGFLQNYLMNIRPALALALLALFTLSVPISSGFVIFHVLEITKHVVSRFLLS